MASEFFPDDYVTLYNLGSALHKQGDEVAAIVEYDRAIALAPNEPTFHFALGISYERLARRAEAAAAYGRYLDLVPQAPNATQVAAKILVLTTGVAAGPQGGA